ncbi:MAG: amino acid ABC transporter substrate-binding protein, partial [Desulfomonilaceae bacterium]
GLSIDTPIGKIKMRACDHQAETPGFWGKLVKVEGYPFPIIKQVVETPADKIMPPCDEVLKAREAKQ